jgi:SnoaL-like domain
MKNPSELAADYVALWNERNDAGRTERLAAQWCAEATYADPLARVAGHSQIAGMIGALQAEYPDFRFRSLGSADGHGEFVRFSWGFGPEGAAPVARGTDIVRIEGGRIAAVIGFLDQMSGVGA